jgi:pimeloyl-ACP methyl ester carboxylesterase
MRPVGNVVSLIFANAGIAGHLLEPYDVISGSSADGNAVGLQGGTGVFKGDLYFYRVDGDLRGRVEKIDTKVCPLYLLTREYDFSCTPEDSKRTAAAIGGAGVTNMEQLGHFPMSENPEQFRRSIAPVLNDIFKQSIPTQGVHV